MKPIPVLAVLAVAFVACGGPAQPEPTIVLPAGNSQLTINVERVKAGLGPVSCSLFNSADGFPGASPIVGGNVTQPAADSVSCVFPSLPSGTFAVVVIQDENANGQLDSNVFGAPTEGYGVTNNVIPATSAPTFEDSKFDLDGQTDVTLAVQLKN